MEFRVLGRLEVVRDGHVLDLGGNKQRAVLAALLARAGQVVSADRLADDVWEGNPPKAAATTLRAYLSNLRKVLEPDRTAGQQSEILPTKPHGYVLDVASDAIDARRFEDIASQATKEQDARATVEKLTDALSLWRGRAFEDFDHISFARSEAARLEELRLRCVEELVERRLDLGQHADLTGELESLTTEHPLRERLWATRLLALYRSGRQGDALKAYEEARRVLSDELGIDPSPELRRLHESILRQDGSLVPGTATTVAVPPGKQTLTFLFTDVELSTAMLLEADDEYAYARIMEEHRAALRDAFVSSGGQGIRTWGDAFFSAFNTATDAVRAALTAQLALLGRDGCEGVRVRMGIHSGEAAMVADDHVGLAVHTAARVQSAAHGGQVLVSQSTKQLVDADLGEGVTFLDLGPHQLKDIPEPVRLYQLVHPELPRSFPPPATLSAMPHNLPAQTTSFVGRTDDVQEVVTALEHARVVTLTGVGGVGKTRLAQEVGAEGLHRYPDGVWLCELAPIVEPDAIVHTIARVLSVNQQQNLTYLESIIASLRRQQALLIFDNCEHLLAPIADLIEEIVRKCPNVTLLATSREGIGAEGEQMLPVRSLAVAAEDAECDALVDAAAVRLFRDRARGVRPDFELGPQNARAVAEICRRLDGIPLAIELAAARLTSMGPLEIAARLDRRFRFLRSGRRTAVERHRTLQATVDWSYTLLAPDEQRLFERLSVFAGGFSMEAAEAICSAAMDADVADLLESLVAKSLVNADVSAEDTRYSMLETLRQYAWDKLAERAEVPAVRDAHLAWYLDLALRSDEQLASTNDQAWFDSVEREVDNLLSAHEWAVTSQNVDAAFRLILALQWFGALRMVRSIFDFRVFSALDIPGADRHELAPVMYALAAGAAWYVGEHAKARDLCDRGLALAPDPDDPRRASALSILSVLAMVEGRLDEALAMVDETIRLAHLGNELILEGQWLLNAAFFAGYTNDSERSLAYLERARQLPIHGRWFRVFERYATGEAILDADPEAAIAALDECVALAREMRNDFHRNVGLLSASSLRGRHFDVYEALGAYTEIIETWQRAGVWRFQWETLRNLLDHLARIGRVEAAVVLYFAAHEAPTADPESGAHGERLAKLIPELEERMGAESFSSARDRGANMSGDEAVAFALSEIDDALASHEQQAAVS